MRYRESRKLLKTKMKVIQISKDGIQNAVPTKGDYYWYFSHGEKGRGRWEVQLPLGTKDFPIDANVASDRDFALVPLHKKDKEGQDRFLLGKGKPDGTWLVLLYLSPGFRGGATYSVEGQATVICCGREAQGDAGRMGSAPCPVIHVTGPCRLTWSRTGRLYGAPADWVAVFDGQWKVLTVEQSDALDAMTV